MVVAEEEIAKESDTSTVVISDANITTAPVKDDFISRDKRKNERRPSRRPERVKQEFDNKIISIRRVTRVVSGGRRFSFSVSMVIGDKKGKVGVGTGKATDTPIAIDKAMRAAKKDMIKVSLTDNKSIAYPVEAKYSSARISIQPAPGKGVIAGSAVRVVLELAGIKEISSKILSRSKNKLNIARATIKALEQLKDSKIKVVLFGDHVTAMPEESMEYSKVDYILTGGDYDFLLLNLVEHLQNLKIKLEPGIWYREELRSKDSKPQRFKETKNNNFIIAVGYSFHREKIMEKKSERGIVKSISRKKRVLARPTPFNTTNFLRAATAIGMSVGEAMNHAEFLYQQGYTSYPRTDNTHYPPTIDLKQILDEMVKVNEFSHLVGEILSRGKLVPSAGEKASKDHPPIHPVSAAPKSKLSERQWKIYELIVRRFLATLSEDAETENQSVEIHVNGEPFIARGQLILKAGWKDVYPYSKITEVILPEMLEGDEVKLLKMNLLEKETVPPPRYSQSSLIKLMEDLNLGTKATRHEILQKLYARHYIAGLKAMEPNQVAFAVIDSLDKYAKRVTEPKMTAELEKEMDLVAAGKKSKKEVVDESRDFLGIILEDMLKNKNNVGSDLRKALQADSVIGTCDKCGKGQLRKLKSKNGKWFLACNRYPDCMNTYPLPQKGKIVSTDKLCEQCGKPVIKVFGKRYRYEMCIFPQCPSKADWKKAGEKKLENTVKKKDSEAISTAVIQKPKQ